MTFRISNLTLVASIGAVLATSLVVPSAQASFAENKTSSVSLRVDGTTIGVSKNVTNAAGDSLNPAFAGGNQDGTGTNELTAMYGARPNGSGGNALVYLPAQGGVVEVPCADSGSQFYQRSQVTLSGFPSSTTDVWAFYDAKVGSGSVVKTFPHFDENRPNPIGAIANTRITDTVNLQKLCNNSTLFVSGTEGTLVIGAGSDAKTTAGVYQNTSTGSVSFDVYVPMNGASDGANSIFLALGFVVDVGANGTLDDTSDDVGIETWLSSQPYWSTFGGDEANALLPACSSPISTSEPCVESTSGIYSADGTSRLDSGYSVKLTMSGGLDDFTANLDLAPTAPIGTSGYAIPAGSIARIAVSWPTAGTQYGALPFGSGDNELNFALAVADTPILVDPTTNINSSITNRWDVQSQSDRIVTTMIGQTRRTSDAISRDTWWPQCEVSIVSGATQQLKCGEGMTGAVTSDFMVFSRVPARVGLMVNPQAGSLAGGLVSTNGQSFAFGPETFDGTSFEFAVAGPSYDFDGNSRTTDGFYYVCIPAAYMTGVFNSSAADAVENWIGTRDGAQVGTAFATGTCGVGDANTGVAASLDPFGYSAPLFKLAPRAIVADPAPEAAAPAPSAEQSSEPEVDQSPEAASTQIAQPAASIKPIIFQNPGAVTGDDVKVLSGAQLATIPAQQFKNLVPSVFKVLTAEQVSELPLTLVSYIRPARLKALSPSAIGGFSAAQLSSLRLASVRKMSPAQLRAITPANLAGTTPLFVSQLKPLMVAALTPAAVQKMTPDQASAIRPASLRQMRVASLRQLDPKAVGALSIRQLKKLRPKQIKALSEAQLAELGSRQLRALNLT
jgi:hypothetical protein